MLSFIEARLRMLSLAEPTEAIEIALSEAVGLVLAEPQVGDVDVPPFDRAEYTGYAVRAADALAGTRLRVVSPPGRSGRVRVRSRSPRHAGVGLLDAATTAEITLEPGETARVTTGTPLPVGADAVLASGDVRAEAGVGGNAARAVRVVREVEPGQGVVPRGAHLRAGALLFAAGRRLTPPMVGLLAAQGCIHPVCHRRVRVAVLAVGDHLVGPGEAPVMHRERNSAGLSVVVPCLQWGATAHDLGAVSERDFPAALARALTAHVVVVVGEPVALVRKGCLQAGVEPVLDGVALEPCRRLSHGVVRDGVGCARHHVVHVAAGPVGLLAAVALLIGPLVARLQGSPMACSGTCRAHWSGAPHDVARDATRALPVALRLDEEARLHATPVSDASNDDLLVLARAGALALLPPGDTPCREGEVVEVVPLGTGIAAPWA